MRGNRINFTGLAHKDRWLIDAIGHAWLTNHEWEKVSNLNFRITTTWNGSYEGKKKRINIGVGSRENRDFLRKDNQAWTKITDSFKNEIIHTVCHELSHAVTAIDEEAYRTGKDNYWVENGLPKNYPHHKYFYMNFKRVCPERLWKKEYSVYPEMAKESMGPISQAAKSIETYKDNPSRKSFKGIVEFFILGALISFFVQGIFPAIILILFNIFLVRKVIGR